MFSACTALSPLTEVPQWLTAVGLMTYWSIGRRGGWRGWGGGGGGRRARIPPAAAGGRGGGWGLARVFFLVPASSTPGHGGWHHDDARSPHDSLALHPARHGGVRPGRLLVRHHG